MRCCVCRLKQHICSVQVSFNRSRAYVQNSLIRLIYALTKPLLPLLLRAFPNAILTTEEIGRAMLIVSRKGAPKRVLEVKDIRALLS